MKQAGQIFLSYSRADSGFALKLGADLRKAGIDVWIDQTDIPPAVPWDEEIQKGLDESSGLLVILSKTSVQSDNVLNEINYALETNKTVWPVLMEAGVKKPFNINRLQHIDFSASYEASYELLIKSLKSGIRFPFLQKKPAEFNLRRLALILPIILLTAYALFLAYKGIHSADSLPQPTSGDSLAIKRDILNGAWTTGVLTNQFDRADKYIITFNFKLEDSVLTGDIESAATPDGKGYHIKKQFREGKLDGTSLRFYTLEEYLKSGEILTYKNYYKGHLFNDSIKFSLTSDRPWDFPEQQFVAGK